jgi:hypothetical protein
VGRLKAVEMIPVVINKNAPFSGIIVGISFAILCFFIGRSASGLAGNALIARGTCKHNSQSHVNYNFHIKSLEGKIR